MSSAFTFTWHVLENLAHTSRRVHYVDFLIKVMPIICLAFIIYVTFMGVFW